MLDVAKTEGRRRVQYSSNRFLSKPFLAAEPSRRRDHGRAIGFTRFPALHLNRMFQRLVEIAAPEVDQREIVMEIVVRVRTVTDRVRQRHKGFVHIARINLEHGQKPLGTGIAGRPAYCFAPPTQRFVMIAPQEGRIGLQGEALGNIRIERLDSAMQRSALLIACVRSTERL